jgi:hypothetical protein
MDSYQVVVSPSSQRTRILLRQGPDELLRAVLPPPSRVRHERAAQTVLEGLSLWLDAALPVALCVGVKDAGFCLGLTDEMGMGARSVFYRVEVASPGDARRRRGRRIQGLGDFSDLRQLRLVGDGEDL